MLKSILSYAFLLITSTAWSQTSEFEELYNKAKYEKCFKATDKALYNSSKNLDALLYQALCLSQMALDPKLEKDFKDGAEKACRLTDKIYKTDKDGKFSNANAMRRQELELLQIKKAEHYIKTNKKEKANKLLEMMINTENSNYARYLRWEMQSTEEKEAGGNMDLLNDAAKNIYQNIQAKNLAKPYLPEVFIQLAIQLSVHDKLSNSHTIISRGEEIFGKSPEWEMARHKTIELKAEKCGTNIDKLDAKEIIEACETIITNHPNESKLVGIRNSTAENMLKSFAASDEKEEFNHWLSNEIPKGKTGKGLGFERLKNILFGLMADRTNTGEMKIADMTANSLFYLQQMAVLINSYDKKPEIYFEQELSDQIAKHHPINAYKLLVNIKAYDPKNKSLAAYDNKILVQTLEDLALDINPDQKWINLQKLAMLYPKNINVQSAQRKFLQETITDKLEKKQYSEAGTYLNEALSLEPSEQSFLALKLRWVKEDYKMNYLGSEVSDEELGWTGKKESCDAGSVSELAHQRLVQRLNYVRRLAGLPDQCELRTEFNKLCQEAALIMHANNNLSHYPPKDWKCYSDNGAKGAGNSNISWGTSSYHSTNALMGQVSDDGSNYQVGHRRWILYPYRKVYGHGSTKNTMVLWSLGGTDCSYPDSSTNIYKTKPVCWPPKDYVPADLIPRRWSFGLIYGEFETAEVSMKQNGKPIKVKKEALSVGFGSNTLVWIPEINPKVKQSTFEVTIKKVKTNSGETKNYTYKVIPIND